MIRPCTNPDIPAMLAIIHDAARACVAPGYQGRGIGGELLDTYWTIPPRQRDNSVVLELSDR
ncbi:GNAT family N-acetyltransferase [Salinispira pacifica]